MIGKALVVGGGPSGLYAAYLLAKRQLAASVVVLEQNPPTATYGFGVSLTDSVLKRLHDVDAESCEQLRERMSDVPSQRLEHPRGDVLVRQGRGAAAIGRVELLALLGQLCEKYGVAVRHGAKPASFAELEPHDLLIGADGANSMVRSALAAEFRTSTHYLRNRYAWYGVRMRFDGAVLTFKSGSRGNWIAHYYPYSPTMSTFVTECDEETWETSGIKRLSADARRGLMEEIFAEQLAGHPLIDNNSVWRCFRVTQSERWAYDNAVLLGDALFTAHFSIGSGTRLALEDAIALAQAIERNPDELARALASFEAGRRAEKQVLLEACRLSWQWFETFAERMRLSPLDFAYDYMIRTGRIDDEKLRLLAPDFMRAYERRKAS